jgi:hypothetical protein
MPSSGQAFRKAVEPFYTAKRLNETTSDVVNKAAHGTLRFLAKTNRLRHAVKRNRLLPPGGPFITPEDVGQGFHDLTDGRPGAGGLQ